MENNRTITPAEITPELITAQTEEWKNSAAEAVVAAEAYLADIEERKRTLETQAQEYQTQVDKLKAKRKTLAAKIVDLSSKGDIDAAAEADAKLEELDKKLAGFERKLRIVSAVDLKGEAALYTAAKEAHTAMEEQRGIFKQKLEELAKTVNEEIGRLREVLDKIGSMSRYYSPCDEANRKFTAVDRHYNEIEKIEQAYREKAEAERKAQEAQRGHTRYVFGG